ncbi:hypothetical protein [Labilithrix luteola]|nr:hypothetical protein [Labilithrix luteola]
MSLPKIVSLLALTFVAAGSVAACAADTSSADEGDVVSGEDALSASTFACQDDSDCVAVDKGGCCPDGTEVAVNKSKTKSYAKSAVCKSKSHICPQHRVLETRVAQCNFATKKCEMVQPADISCGGFIKHAHNCPDGYLCLHDGNPDRGGHCEAQ